MIDVIRMVFVAAGVILAVYAFSQFVLAFKNEDEYRCSRAVSLLGISAILIGFPTIIGTIIGS